MSESRELLKAMAAVAWLKTAPAWQKIQAAESALDSAIDLLTSMQKTQVALMKNQTAIIAALSDDARVVYESELQRVKGVKW